MNYEERWRFLISSKDLSIRKFCQELGITTQSFYNLINRGTYPDTNNTNALKNFIPDLNFNWLFFGEGEPFLSEFSIIPLQTKKVINKEDSKKEVQENVTSESVPKNEEEIGLLERIERIEAFIMKQEASFAEVGKNRVYLRSELSYKNVA